METKLEFCEPEVYFEIYSSSFNGKKDPDYYDHLRGEEDTFFFMDDNPAEYKARFRPIAPLFSNKHYAQHEASIQKNLKQFSTLLSERARNHQPCNLGLGYRSLGNGVMNDFIFSDVPDNLQTLATSEFDDPLTLATGDVFNWTTWLARNFPTLFALIMRVNPSFISKLTQSFDGMGQTIDIMATIVEHEKNPKTPKNPNSVMQHLLHPPPPVDASPPVSDAILRSEAIGLLLAGASDPPNILAFGTFVVSQDAELQRAFFEELKAVWPERDADMPGYAVLRRLPVLRGVVKESLRLTYGVTVGPPRVIREGGARVGGRWLPEKTVVAASSYFVHMDEAAFPQPEKFEPRRWASDEPANSLVAFSRGRRMCPAEQFSYILLFASFAMVFRRFHVEAYQTTMKDFEWKQYFSNVFTGAPLQAVLRERVD